MKVSKRELESAIKRVSVINTKGSILPILQTFRIQGKGDTFTITATNLNQFATSNFKAEGEIDVCVGAEILSKTVFAMPDGSMNIEAIEGAVKIIGDVGTYKMATLPPEDFPKLLEADVDPIKVSGADLISSLNVGKAFTLNDELRPAMTGVCVSDSNVVATDAHSLVAIDKKLGVEFLIPKDGIDALKALDTSGDIDVYVVANCVNFCDGTTKVGSILIDGKFPNWEAVMPKKSVGHILVNRTQLLSSVKRLGVFTRDTTNKTVGIKILNKEMLLYSVGENNDSGEEFIEASIEIESVELAFNSQKMSQVLRAMPEEEIRIDFYGHGKAIIVSAGIVKGLLMPVFAG